MAPCNPPTSRSCWNYSRQGRKGRKGDFGEADWCESGFEFGSLGKGDISEPALRGMRIYDVTLMRSTLGLRKDSAYM